MDNPYRVHTPIAPRPVSSDEVREFFEKLKRRRSVNPQRESSSIKKR